MEHDVYLCGWSQSPKGFSLWTKDTPRVQASGTTLPAAMELLLEKIRNAQGALHAVLEFDPPLPRGEHEKKYVNPELYLICGDDRFETDTPRSRAFETPDQREARLQWLDAFFQRPVCRKCTAATSPRSACPIHLSHVRPQYDSAFGHLGVDGTTRAEIFSEEFVALLSPMERANLELRAVNRKGRRKFYELIGPAGPPFVGVAGLEVRGWKCASCGFACWGYWVDGLDITSFVACCDLPAPLPGIFTAGTPPEVHLCVTGARWRELVGRKGTRGIVSRALGVVSDAELERHPTLPPFTQS